MFKGYSKHILPVILSFLGQYPVKRVITTGPCEFSLFSYSGIWSIIIFLLNVMIAQSLILCFIETTPETLNNSGLPKLETKIFLCLGILSINEIYAAYITYLFAIPGFIHVQKLIRFYDEKFQIGHINFSYRRLVYTLLSNFVWWIGAVISVVGVQDVVTTLRNNEPTLHRFFQKSWLICLFPDSINWEVWIRVLFSIHLVLGRIANALAFEQILACSNMIVERMSLIVAEDIKKFHEKEYLSKCQSKQKFVPLEQICSKLADLGNIFTVLCRASNTIILVLMLIETICLIGMMFIIPSFLSIWTNSDQSIFIYSLFGFLIINIGKLVSLTSCGQNLIGKCDELKKSVSDIVPNQSISTDQDLIHLKLSVFSMQFTLSGHDYFKLNHETLTSILSTVITYSVVLLQFRSIDVEH